MQAVITEELFVPHYEIDPAGRAGNSVHDRCRFAVDGLCIWYSNRRYPANRDVILAARDDPELMESIQAWRLEGSRKRGRQLDLHVAKRFERTLAGPDTHGANHGVDVLENRPASFGKGISRGHVDHVGDEPGIVSKDPLVDYPAIDRVNRLHHIRVKGQQPVHHQATDVAGRAGHRETHALSRS